MANFEWIEEAPEGDWVAGISGKHSRHMSLREFADRCDSAEALVIDEFREWAWTHKTASYALAWSDEGDSDDKVILMRTASRSD